MNQKVFIAFTHTKNVEIASFIKAKIRIRTGTATPRKSEGRKDGNLDSAV
jgi:hypothetical protein